MNYFNAFQLSFLVRVLPDSPLQQIGVAQGAPLETGMCLSAIRFFAGLNTDVITYTPIFPLGHETEEPSEEVLDLAETLRSGAHPLCTYLFCHSSLDLVWKS